MMDIPRQGSVEATPHLCGPNIHVSIDGVETDDCVAYDMDEGWAEVLERNAEGKLFLRGDGIAEKRVYGEIRVWEASE